MLSALVQSAAAIFAIVFSLSLIAMQLAAPYSIRILKYYLNDLHFRLLFWILVSIIVLGLCTLLVIEEPEISLYTKILSTIIIFLFIFMILELKLYLYSLMNSLKPTRLIDQILSKVDLVNILSIENLENDDNPILPISDIIIESLKRNDEITVLYGLNAIRSRLESFLQIDSMDREQQMRIAYVFSYHLSLIEKLVLVNNNFINISLDIIENIFLISLKSIEVNKKEITRLMILHLKNMGPILLDNKLESIIVKISKSLGKSEKGIGIISIRKKYFDLAEKAVLALHDIGKEATRNRISTSTINVVIDCLKKIGSTAFYESADNDNKRELDIISQKVTEALLTIALEAIYFSQTHMNTMLMQER